MLLIVLLVLAIAKSPQRYLTGQCKLSNESHGNISRIDASKTKQAFSFAPGVETSSRAATHWGSQTMHIERVLTNDIKNLQTLLELHVNGFKSLVKCDAMMCPWDDSVCPGVYEYDEWSAMPWNVQEINAYRMANVSYVFEHIIQLFKRQEQIC